MENEIIYSDQQETRIIRVSDVIPVIEAHIGLQVVEIRPTKKREDVDNDFYDFYFPDTKPLALWWFYATYESPEGKREGMVLVALEEHGLRTVSFDPPKLLFFSQALRERARAEAPAFTREYLDQMERAFRIAYLSWKTANEYAKDIPDLRNDLYMFYAEARKVGFLLPDAEEGGPHDLGLRKLYLPDWLAKSPDEYITGDDEVK